MLRPRRNRKSAAIREMIAETNLSVSNLIFPLFLEDENSAKIEINSMPGIFRFGETELFQEVETCLDLGISSFVLFPSVKEKYKTEDAAYALSEENYYLKRIHDLKQRFPEIILMSDVALDPYSSHGQDGLVKDGKVLNDETVEVLSQMSLLQAQAGIDIIGPSDMMDGRVGAIRNELDQNNFTDVSIMSYTAKYASAFYGPFRDALDSAPKGGDKKTYQMDPSNKREALLEAQLDVEEGADFLMVKPALSYLDIISDLNANFDIPIAAYNVSGEYAMVKAAAEKGWINGDAIMHEILLSIRRAGATSILTYFAKEFAIKNS